MNPIALVFSVLLLFPRGYFTPAETAIAVRPMGTISDELVSEAVRGIEGLYTGLAVDVLPREDMPREAYYRKNRRYRADTILDFLDRTTPAKYAKVLALTDRDISTTKGRIHDWGIFGLGSLGGRACVVSTYRLGRGGVSREKFLERFVKVVNHELGHTFGLRHCPTPGCVMEDAKGTIKTVDRETGRFCPRCREKLKEKGVEVSGP